MNGGKHVESIADKNGYRKPRIGVVSSLNGFPLHWHLKSGTVIDMDIIRDTPDRLAEKLNRSELDISAISVVEFIQSESKLYLLPSIAIGSDGPILSCNIVSKSDLVQLDGKVVSICSTSRTTALLAKLLLEKKYNVAPIYVYRPPVLEQMLEGADAAVVIGDEALKAKYNDAPRRGLKVFDTGELWRSWTGHPMVFSVWAVRHDYALENPELVRAIHSELIDKTLESEFYVDAMISDAVCESNFSGEIIKNYFRSLNYSLGEKELMGMDEFFRIGADHLCIQKSEYSYTFWRDVKSQ